MTPNEEIQTMTAKEFRELGYLQELNRQFLHPLGLALTVRVEEDGTETVAEVWDYRHDPEGICFDSNAVDTQKAQYVMQQQIERRAARLKALGYIIQPPLDSGGVL